MINLCLKKPFNLNFNVSFNENISLAFGIKDSTFEHINLDYKSSNISTEKDNITIDIKNATIYFLANPFIESTPKFFFGKGSYILDIAKVDLKTKFSLMNFNNTLKFEMNNIEPKIDLEHFGLYTVSDATNDLIELGYLAGNATLDYVGKMLTSKDKRLAKNITELVNQVLGFIPKELVIPGTSLNVFLELIDKIEINESHFYIGNNFSAECKGNCIDYNEYKPIPPTILNKHEEYKGFQAFVSDYTVNTLMIAAYRSSLLNNLPFGDVLRMLGKEFDLVKFFSIFFPEVKDYKNSGFNVALTFREPPITEFNGNKTNSVAKPVFTFSYVKEANKAVFLFNLTAGTVFKGWFELDNKTLAGYIETLLFDFIVEKGELDPSIKTIKGFVNTLRNIIVPQINSLIANGIQVPPTPYLDLSKCAFSVKDRYLRIGLDLKEANEEIREMIEWVIKKVASLHRIQKMQKMIAENIPKNLPKWIKVPF